MFALQNSTKAMDNRKECFPLQAQKVNNWDVLFLWEIFLIFDICLAEFNEGYGRQGNGQQEGVLSTSGSEGEELWCLDLSHIC